MNDDKSYAGKSEPAGNGSLPSGENDHVVTHDCAGSGEEMIIARAICRSDNDAPSCVMDSHPEREPCNDTNCRRFEQARAVMDALSHQPAHVAAEDEAYELGKRDGYEDAIQDLDIATGGDGEFKGSTISGEIIDVEAMKQRIVERFANASEAELARQDIQRLNEQDKTISAWENAHLIDAGAEARLREIPGALGCVIPIWEMIDRLECRGRELNDNGVTPNGQLMLKAAFYIRALSAHLNASDCDKQGK